jgi:hypothetical protein
MDGRQRATKVMKITEVKNSHSSIVNAVCRDEARVVVEKNSIPVAAIVLVDDLRRLVHYERINRDQEDEDPFAVIERAREAFKDAPPEEIERETDRIIARVRAENRAARERDAMAATG